MDFQSSLNDPSTTEADEVPAHRRYSPVPVESSKLSHLYKSKKRRQRTQLVRSSQICFIVEELNLSRLAITADLGG